MKPTTPLTSQPDSPRMGHACPLCHRLLYDRHLTNCGYCGAAIPERLQFTAEEIAELDRETAKLDEHRKQREHDAQISRLTGGAVEDAELSGLW